MKHLSSILGLLFLSIFLSAQETGSFDISVAFDEVDYMETRTLYFYVPTDYDAEQSYKLVVGFRGGPNSDAGQFRDQLTFLSDSLDAIILCPENAEHFWNEEGLTKQLFQYSLENAISIYNIDPDYVYLTGLSYGGRHAVIVSMDTDNGPIPNLRGVIPFAAGSDSQLETNFDDIADFPPACICIGLQDSENFITVANTIHDGIIAHGGQSILNEIEGVGHTVDFPTYPDEMMECFAFIEAQYEAVGVSENVAKEDLGFNVYPNPSADQASFELPEAWNVSRIYVLNSAGAVISNVENTERTIDVHHLPAGFYTLVIETDTQRYTETLSVKR
ncbi:MAG: hypothetical protein ACI9RU_003249 [Litorivivens sp.]|jgi:hypothetical protein